MIEIKAPNDFREVLAIVQTASIFLGGSIEMGKAEKWQDAVAKQFAQTNFILLNPRRDDWDASWKQEATNEQFRNQVEWELEAQRRADFLFYYFAPGTQSPITLLELGLAIDTKPLGHVIVCCPEGFWRKGNVDIVCQRAGVTMIPSYSDLLAQFVNPANVPTNKGVLTWTT